ncbi:KRAB-A domain-containing protein 2-like [Colias croceus]|uniref:KRAB-A domain-containing protein 2-like n=1 Tax=Colias crocea TaxID=72248 RepID=UPI001E27BC5E|nr:KRAB-A domain-containing protein 2-like [Colias croceus]
MSLIKQAKMVGIRNKRSGQFKYHLVKKRFIAGILYGPEVERPLTTKQMNKLISDIKENEEISDKYEVINQGNIDRLIVKRQTTKEHIAEVLTFSELFDVITEVHLALGHQKIHTVFDILKRRYYIIMEWLQLFTSVCNVCLILKYCLNTKNLSRLNHHIVQLNIISKSGTGRDLRGIIYMDYLTNYVLLRKIKNKKYIAYELFRIFMDFGIPDCIEVNDIQFFQSNIDTLRELIPHCALNVEQKKLTKLMPLEKIVNDSVENWLTNTQSCNFTFKLVELQWKLNLKTKPVCVRSKIITNNSKETAYFALFNRNVHVKMRPPLYKETDSKISEVLTCMFCKKTLHKAYKCFYCHEVFHFFCCKRRLCTTIDKTVLVICNQCDNE